jgi:hypothetical protein
MLLLLAVEGEAWLWVGCRHRDGYLGGLLPRFERVLSGLIDVHLKLRHIDHDLPRLLLQGRVDEMADSLPLCERESSFSFVGISKADCPISWPVNLDRIRYPGMVLVWGSYPSDRACVPVELNIEANDMVQSGCLVRRLFYAGWDARRD